MKTPSKRRTSRAPKLDPKVFVKAAEYVAIEAEDFACCALDTVENSCEGPHCLYFEDALRPREGEHHYAWYGLIIEPSNRHARVIGLLLCAELVKDGFEPSPYKRG